MNVIETLTSEHTRKDPPPLPIFLGNDDVHRHSNNDKVYREKC